MKLKNELLRDPIFVWKYDTEWKCAFGLTVEIKKHGSLQDMNIGVLETVSLVNHKLYRIYEESQTEFYTKIEKNPFQ